MDQRVLAAFKTYSLRRTFAQALAATDKDIEKTLMRFWKDYKIYGCVKNLAWVWGDVTKQCMNASEKRTVKRFARDFRAFSKGEEVVKINKAVVEMTKPLTWVWTGMIIRSS